MLKINSIILTSLQPFSLLLTIVYILEMKIIGYEFSVILISGNHTCVAVISNFIPKSDVDYYTVPQGLETEPKLPPFLVDPLHKFIMQV